jgi:HK97 gp10 family phage protein
MFDISVIGNKKLEKKLSKMEKKVQSKLMKKAMKDAMKPVQELAKQRAPVLDGLLRRSIRLGVKTSRRTGISVMLRTGTRKQLKIPADAKYYYPAAHEYGTRHMPARSFLRSSLDTKKEIVLKKFSTELNKLLVKA